MWRCDDPESGYGQVVLEQVAGYTADDVLRVARFVEPDDLTEQVAWLRSVAHAIPTGHPLYRVFMDALAELRNGSGFPADGRPYPTLHACEW